MICEVKYNNNKNKTDLYY